MGIFNEGIVFYYAVPAPETKRTLSASPVLEDATADVDSRAHLCASNRVACILVVMLRFSARECSDRIWQV